MMKNNWKLLNFNLKYIFGILVIGATCFITSNYFVSICIVNGNSMLPTFKDGEILLENKMSKKYNRGDIIVIKKNDLKIVKRIIGCPGDKIIIRNGYIYVNEIKFDNIFINEPGSLDNEIKLGYNEYVVLGDNRDESIDSRFDEIGIVNKNEIKGKILNYS